jgi:hypothetical protein
MKKHAPLKRASRGKGKSASRAVEEATTKVHAVYQLFLEKNAGWVGWWAIDLKQNPSINFYLGIKAQERRKARMTSLFDCLVCSSISDEEFTIVAEFFSPMAEALSGKGLRVRRDKVLEEPGAVCYKVAPIPGRFEKPRRP